MSGLGSKAAEPPDLLLAGMADSVSASTNSLTMKSLLYTIQLELRYAPPSTEELTEKLSKVKLGPLGNMVLCDPDVELFSVAI
jgi:hypothetical protein